MNSEASEKLFANYLVKHGVQYQQGYPVSNGNIDFLIEARDSKVLCDVKEVRDPKEDPHGRIEANGHIRSDIRKLRAKFKNGRPDDPVVLVTMNF